MFRNTGFYSTNWPDLHVKPDAGIERILMLLRLLSYYIGPVSPRILELFYIVRYYIKWVKPSWIFRIFCEDILLL